MLVKFTIRLYMPGGEFNGLATIRFVHINGCAALQCIQYFSANGLLQMFHKASSGKMGKRDWMTVGWLYNPFFSVIRVMI